MIRLLGDRTVAVVGEEDLVYDETGKKIQEATWVFARYDLNTGEKIQCDHFDGFLEGMSDILLAGKPCIALSFQ